MKKLFQICLIAIMSLTVSVVAAQQPPKKVVVETARFDVRIETPMMEKRINNSLSNDKGVIDVTIDAKKDLVIVRYDKAVLNEAKLLKEFEKINVKAKVSKPEPPKKK